VVAAIGTYFAFHGSLPWSSPVTYHALLTSSEGLATAAPVRFAGVDVGEVTAIGRGPGATADATFTLDSGAPRLYRDATVRLRPRLFLEGGFYLDLSPGTGFTAPRLPAGGTIPVSHTSVAVQADQSLQTSASRYRADDATILHELRIALATGGAADVRAIVRQLPSMLKSGAIAAQASIGTGPADLAGLIRNSAAITTTLDKNTAGLVQDVVDGAAVNSVLAQHAHDLQTTLDQADALFHELPPVLAKVDASIPPVDHYYRALLPALPALPGSLRRTSALLAQLQRVTAPSSLPRLLSVAAPAIKLIPTLQSRTLGLLPYVRQTSECTTRRTVPTLDTKLNDGPFSTGYPAYLDLIHGLTLLASNYQAYDGNGAWARSVGGIGDQSFSIGSLEGNSLSSFGPFVGSTAPGLGLLGVRPQWNGPTPPPFHPEALCTSQPPPSLAAAAGVAEHETSIGRRR
jgi:virulence factor Mce-like protein